MKRGVSQLIATVLIVGIVIAALSYVFFFSTSFFEKEAGRSTEISEKKLAVLQGAGKFNVLSVSTSDVDAVTDSVRFEIENLGPTDLTGFKFIVYGDKDKEIIDLDFVIDKLKKDLVVINFNSANVGEVKKIDIIPKAILVISTGELEPEYIPEAMLSVRGTLGDEIEICGNNLCEIGESCAISSCPQDCGTCISCGNNVKEDPEECDGTDFGGSNLCRNYDPSFSSGTLLCNNCGIDTSGCVLGSVCGNNVKEGTEECDGSDFGSGETNLCVDYDPSFSSGTLLCDASCNLDNSGCGGVPSIIILSPQNGAVFETTSDSESVELSFDIQNFLLGRGSASSDHVNFWKFDDQGNSPFRIYNNEVQWESSTSQTGLGVKLVRPNTIVVEDLDEGDYIMRMTLATGCTSRCRTVADLAGDDLTNPEATDTVSFSIEYLCIDNDGDGAGDGAGCLGTDCNDFDPSVHDVCSSGSIPISGCAILDQPGRSYDLTTDVETDGSCFVILASGVSLDGNGHTATHIGDSPSGSGVAIGFGLNSVSVSDLTIKNFGTGINAFDLESTSIVRNLVDSSGSGIVISGANNSEIRGNRVLRTIGTGLQIGSVSNSVIWGNTVTSSGRNDFRISNSYDNTFTSNSIENDIICNDSDDNINGGGNSYTTSTCPWLP